MLARIADHGGGTDAAAILDVVFHGRGHDDEFGREFLRSLFAEDPRFYEPSTGNWQLVENNILDRHFDEVPFVVVDLETTGNQAGDAGVTEIGAVRVVGGEEVGCFEQLVKPSTRIPSFVARLTGINDAMVADAPPLTDVIGPFVEFAVDSILVAHNAAFDTLLLDRECRRVVGRPLGLPTLCTVKLAQRLLPQLHRTSLDALSEHFGLESDARHRALGDARATAEVLRRLIEVLRQAGSTSAGAVVVAQNDPNPAHRLEINVSQADLSGLPQGPGVFRLIGENDDCLYIGRALDLRRHVTTLFVTAEHASERRLRMLAKTYEIDFEACGSMLEAGIREAAAVRRYEPEYNRSGRHMPNGNFVKLSLRGKFPRMLAVPRIQRDQACYVGPLSTKALAQGAADMLAAMFGLRTCPGTLSSDPAVTPCELAAPGFCTSPCNGAVSESDYAQQVERFLEFAAAGPGDLHTSLTELRRTAESSGARRFAEAARRAERLHRSFHWNVDTHNYLALAPGACGGVFVAAVVQGRCRDIAEVADEAGARQFLKPATTWVQEDGGRISNDAADASTILAHWVRTGQREPGEESLAFDPVDPASVKAAAAHIGALAWNKPGN